LDVIVHTVLRLLTLALLSLPTMSTAQGTVSSSALAFIEAGISVARAALGGGDVLTVGEAKSKGVSVDECRFEHIASPGVTVLLGRCASMRATLVLEVTADASDARAADLPTGLRYGMSPSEVVERLGPPSADRAQIAGLQGLSTAAVGDTDLYYVSEPKAADSKAVEISFERGRLVRVRWLLGPT